MFASFPYLEWRYLQAMNYSDGTFMLRLTFETNFKQGNKKKNGCNWNEKKSFSRLLQETYNNFEKYPNEIETLKEKASADLIIIHQVYVRRM